MEKPLQMYPCLELSCIQKVGHIEHFHYESYENTGLLFATVKQKANPPP